MCSIGEDDFGDDGAVHAMTTDKDIYQNDSVQSGICQKCNNSAEVVVKLDFREPDCKECFLAYVRHKFRASLGSSKILPKDSNVLLIMDESPESIVLLDMMYFAQSQNTFKRLHCNVNILVIDESCLQKDFILAKQNLFKVQKFLLNYNLDSYVTSINGKNDPVKFINLNEYVNNEDIKKNETCFYESYEKIKTLTSKQDFIEKFRKNIIRLSAKKLKKNYVFLSNTSPNLAVTLLTNISLGRGGSTAMDVSLCDDRISDIKLIRPLKDLNNNEVENYLKVNNIAPFSKTCYGFDLGPNSSIQNLTSNFILNLQKGFSSTVSTVFRTGDKIALNKNINKEFDNMKLTSKFQCSFCNSPLDYFNSKTLLAIEFSKLVSENTSQDNLENTKRLQIKAKNNLCENELFSSELCHGCKNIYQDCFDSKLFDRIKTV